MKSVYTILALLLCSCAIMGPLPAGHPVTVSVGVYADTAIPLETTAGVLTAVQQALAAKGCQVHIAFIAFVPRPGRTVDAVFTWARRQPRQGADKVLVLIGADAGDLFLGVISPVHFLGKAEAWPDPDRRRCAVARAEVADIDHLLAGRDTPAIHEVCHLLGADHTLF